MIMALVTRSSPFLTPLDSDEGKKLLRESQFTSLLPFFCKQVSRKYCALCSTAICLNEILDLRSRSLHDCSSAENFCKVLRAKEKAKTLREDDILLLGEENEVFRKEEVDRRGMTLKTFSKLIDSLGMQPTLFHAFPSSKPNKPPGIASADEFRSIVLQHLKKPRNHVVLNFDVSVFFEDLPNFGHFSPLGGYHAEQDRFLLLDVWPADPVAWVKTQDMFNAMTLQDSCSRLPRGFCLIDPGDSLRQILTVYEGS